MKKLLPLFLCFASSSFAESRLESLSTSQAVDEVISYATHPHAYDYRKNDFELSLSGIDIVERNNFESSAFQIGINIPLASGGFLRSRVRRVFVKGTKSTNYLARTPYKQLGLVSRFEFGGDFSLALMEGRSFTMLSPAVADFEHILLMFVGLHYMYPTDSNLFWEKKKPATLPGQWRYEPTWVVPIGFLWKVYFSQSLGIGLEYGYQIPLEGRKDEMPYWTYTGFNLNYGI